MKPAATVLSVVIPSWNTRELTRIALERLFAARRPASEVIVVENGSEDGSAEMIAERFPEVQLIRNARNEGFARGSNQGLAAARGRYVFLLNTDTEVAEDAIELLIEWLEAHPEYGACAPRLIHPDGRTQRTVQAFPGLWTPLFFGSPLERWFPDSRELRRYFLRDWDQESSRDVDQPPAAALMLRRQVLDRIGLLDEELWLFFNDVDLSLRMRAAGWKTRYLAEARVVHHVGASTRRFSGFVMEYQKNRLAFYRKHFGRVAGLWLKACVTLVFLDWILQQKKRQRRGDPAEPAEPIGPTARVFRAFLAL